MHVLVVDDSAVSRRALELQLKALEHTCVCAADASSAWALVQEQYFDVIITDWVMPDFDGIELCRRVRAAASNKSSSYTYIIVVTTMREGHNGFVEAMEAGADDFLFKPVASDQLRGRLLAAARVTSLHRRLLEQRRELEHVNQRLFSEGRIDALTGVGNRLKLDEDLQMLWGRAKRYGHIYCVIVFDVDHFKALNDTYGHLEGDVALKLVGASLSKSCREGDSVYRFGGEEFVTILPEQQLHVGAAMAHRSRNAIAELRIPNERAPLGHLTLSAGVALMDAKLHDHAGSVMTQADEALYFAKRNGRDCVASFARPAPLLIPPNNPETLGR